MCMCIFVLWFVCLCVCVCVCACVRMRVCARVIVLFIRLSLAHGCAHTQSFTLGARPRYTSLHTQAQCFIHTIYSSISENRVNPMAQLLAWWRGVWRTSPSSPWIHMAPGVFPHKISARHSGETKAPVDTVRKPGTILVPYQCTSSLSVLSAAQLIQQHTSPSLTQSQPEIHHSSSFSPPPRHVTMHMHLPRVFNIPIFTISNFRPFYQCTGTHHVHSTLITTIVTFSNFGL